MRDLKQAVMLAAVIATGVAAVGYRPAAAMAGEADDRAEEERIKAAQNGDSEDGDDGETDPTPRVGTFGPGGAVTSAQGGVRTFGRNPARPGASSGGGIDPGSSEIDGGEQRITGFAASLDENNAITMTDLLNGRVIISPNRGRVWVPNTRAERESLEPSIDFQPKSDGFDVVLDFVNNTNEWRSPGIVLIGGIRFGEEIATRDFRFDCKEVILDHGGEPRRGGGAHWPQRQYSPVAIIQEAPYTIGASIQYPVTEYKHDVFVRIEAPGGRFARDGLGWQILFALNNNDRLYAPDGDIAPGESRTYTISIRAMRDRPEQWVRTLLPYRDFFRLTYGGVEYTRDPRPIQRYVMSQSAEISETNPYGFQGEYRRPDTNGWQPTVDAMEEDRTRGWNRFMIWAPSGLYRLNRANNFPFQFTSQWRAVPRIMESLHVLRAFGQSGAELGLWWGRSSQVTFGWDTAERVLLDPEDSVHANMAFDEIDGATNVNVGAIGLDSFRGIRAFDAYEWMRRMQQRAPGVKFIVEPRTADFMHTISPMFALATRPPEEMALNMDTPHDMADFLLPGHETWGLIKRTDLADEVGRWPTEQDISDKIAEVAALGYVPCIACDDVTVEPRHYAQDTWLVTVPEDLRIDP